METIPLLMEKADAMLVNCIRPGLMVEGVEGWVNSSPVTMDDLRTLADDLELHGDSEVPAVVALIADIRVMVAMMREG